MLERERENRRSNVIKHDELCAHRTPFSIALYVCRVHCMALNECNWYNHHLMGNAINAVGIQFQNQFATHTLSGTYTWRSFFSCQSAKTCYRELNWPYSICSKKMCILISLLFPADEANRKRRQGDVFILGFL